MVVFTCGYCGESVQKPKVEKHYLTKCRNKQPNLSCMDCFKDFLGNDYEAHTKCITEEERYSGKGFQAKEKKGEKKQNVWVEMLQSVLDEQKSAPSNVLRIIETISKHNNTPRKKPKFVNFVKNVCGSKTNLKDIDQAWDLISVKLTALSNINNRQSANTVVNGNASLNGIKDEETLENKGNGEEDVSNDTSQVNGLENGTEKEENGEVEEKIPEKLQNGQPEEKSKKLSKKARKEEKKRKKYEAELQSVNVAPTEVVEEEEDVECQAANKKGKKKKNKSESSNGDVVENQDSKIKKRKRQDTTNSVPEIPDVATENIENEPVVLSKRAQKKKLKIESEEAAADESVCLHDQNVAKIEGLSMKCDKFNWHAVILSVLQKKDNEMPFKRLQKKVLMEYSEATGREVDDRIADKFIKKLKSAPKVRVVKNSVTLVE